MILQPFAYHREHGGCHLVARVAKFTSAERRERNASCPLPACLFQALLDSRLHFLKWSKLQKCRPPSLKSNKALCVCMHAHMCVRACVCVCASVYVCMHMITCMYAWVCISSSILTVCVYVYACMHACVRVHACMHGACVCVCVFVCMHVSTCEHAGLCVSACA